MFVSLGVDCGTAIILNKIGSRQLSLPFDWVVTYEGITNIINNDFNNFLPEVCDNKHNKLNNGVLFLHNNFPSDNQKMNNRITLFKTILERTTDKIS